MERTAALLKRERELRQLSLGEISHATRIPVRTLEALEAGKTTELPDPVFVRGFVRSYARVLGITLDTVSTPEFKGVVSTDQVTNTAPFSLVARAEGATGHHRFGLAVTLAGLLILSVLALSVMLKPRQQFGLVELSSAVDVIPSTTPFASHPS